MPHFSSADKQGVGDILWEGFLGFGEFWLQKQQRDEDVGLVLVGLALLLKDHAGQTLGLSHGLDVDICAVVAKIHDGSVVQPVAFTWLGQGGEVIGPVLFIRLALS